MSKHRIFEFSMSVSQDWLYKQSYDSLLFKPGINFKRGIVAASGEVLCST